MAAPLANCTVLLVRHGEKPDGGTGDDAGGASGLSPAGQARAQAYVAYFQNYVALAAEGPRVMTPIVLDHLFAAKDSAASQRPRLTLEPLATALGKSIHDEVKDKDWQRLVDELAGYQDANLLVCWHHGEILDLANALLAKGGIGDPKSLPAASAWPPRKWPGEVFGWVLQIVYDGDGNARPEWVRAINQQLMFDDTIDPPGKGA